jgi:ParB-like chromosome segregation protein Spo0J
MSSDRVKELVSELVTLVEAQDLKGRVELLNGIKKQLKQMSPHSSEPVECVMWVPSDLVVANDYNPNSVAPPEMKLLEVSIHEDGYTQPIVTWFHDGIYEVVDGFHRNRVGKESLEIRKRIHSYLPVVVINEGKEELGDRMASTIRHNRARGKHSVDHMSEIVVELKKRNRSDEWIAKNLGMDPDEILRLCQISGLTEMFADSEFSKSWDIDVEANESAEINLEGRDDDVYSQEI